MIQRIQTVYLFLSALFTALLLFLPLAVGVTVSGGPVRSTLWGWTDPASADSLSSGAVHWIAGGLSVLVLALALITIFGFRNRPLQKKLCIVQVVLLLVVCGLLGWCLGSFAAPLSAWSLSAASVFPVVSLILTLLAMRGISKDEPVGPLARPGFGNFQESARPVFSSPVVLVGDLLASREPGTVRICVRCLGTGAAMRLRLS